MKILHLDIETVCAIDPTIDDIKIPGNIKKPETIAAYKANPENLKKIIKQRSVDPVDAKIICMSFALGEDDIQSIFGDDEEKLIKEFSDWYMDAMGNSELFTTIFSMYNGREFDYLLIALRLQKYDLKAKTFFPMTIRKDRFFDPLLSLAGLRWGYKVSMDRLANFYGLGGKSEVTGADVYDMYKAGKWKEISEYCCGDVELLRKLYFKMI